MVWDRISKKEILMDYVSRSCDLPKMKIGGGVDAYVSRSCDLPKKEIFDGLHKHFWGAFSEKLPKKENLMDYISIFRRHFLKIYQKRNFDGLCKQVT